MLFVCKYVMIGYVILKFIKFFNKIYKVSYLSFFRINFCFDVNVLEVDKQVKFKGNIFVKLCFCLFCIMFILVMLK